MQPAFSIHIEEANDQHTLVLHGELDLAAAPAVDIAVARLCRAGARRVVLDLRQLDFADASGLHAMLAARRVCLDRRVEFGIVPGRQQVQRLIELSGLLDSLPFVVVVELDETLERHADNR